MSLRVYVASNYLNAGVVRDLHDRLLSYGIQPTSSWATAARGPESPDPAVIARAIAQNDADIERSDAMIVIATERSGETFAEARHAIFRGIPVYWVGRRILSAYRSGVVLCEDADDALIQVIGLARKRA